jgi:hypothetical protein
VCCVEQAAWVKAATLVSRFKAMHGAIADGLRLEASEKARSDNKATFKP